VRDACNFLSDYPRGGPIVLSGSFLRHQSVTVIRVWRKLLVRVPKIELRHHAPMWISGDDQGKRGSPRKGGRQEFPLRLVQIVTLTPNGVVAKGDHRAMEDSRGGYRTTRVGTIPNSKNGLHAVNGEPTGIRASTGAKQKAVRRRERLTVGLLL